MRIDGASIAQDITAKLKIQTNALAARGIRPHLAIVLIGNDPASLAYIRRKKKVGEEIGATVTLFHEKETTTEKELRALIERLNTDPSVHGIIIQRPVPVQIPKETLDMMVVREKDVDGFRPDSPFMPPIGEGVIHILEWIYKNENTEYRIRNTEFRQWLSAKHILIIGKGETGGKPIAYLLGKRGVEYTVADSRTPDLKSVCLSSDIIISCVGKANIVRHQMVTIKTILIGVGLHTQNGKLVPDYDQQEIADTGAYYTPVPGGIGPVNVASLFGNLVAAAITG